MTANLYPAGTRRTAAGDPGEFVMSDKRERPNLRVITLEEANNFLEGRGVNFPECPMCQQKNYLWSTIGKENNVLLFEDIVQHKPDGSKSQIPSYIMEASCSNCGYMIKFDALPILKWKFDREN